MKPKQILLKRCLTEGSPSNAASCFWRQFLTLSRRYSQYILSPTDRVENMSVKNIMRMYIYINYYIYMAQLAGAAEYTDYISVER